jgi:hypothetical protein
MWRLHERKWISRTMNTLDEYEFSNGVVDQKRQRFLIKDINDRKSDVIDCRVVLVQCCHSRLHLHRAIELLRLLVPLRYF